MASKYTPGTYVKAIVAFFVTTIGALVTAAGGADFSQLDLGQILLALSAGLAGGGGVFATPNKKLPETSPVDVALDSVSSAVEAVASAQKSISDVQAQAAAGAKKVQEAVTGLAAGAQNAVDLVERVISAGRP